MGAFRTNGAEGGEAYGCCSLGGAVAEARGEAHPTLTVMP